MHFDSKVALLGNVIDYAGTFPPAALNLSDALKKAASFRSIGRHPWLMGKIALPLADIKTITAAVLMENGADGSAWNFTALAGALSSIEPAEIARSVEWELREVLRFNSRGKDSPIRQTIVSYELKLPIEGLPPLLNRIEKLCGNEISLCFEISWDDTWEARLKSLSDSIDQRDSESLRPIIKIRTGGKFIPSFEQVAKVIMACRQFGLRIKATQGLHHAITQNKDLGFVNLFSALAFAYGLGAEKFDLKKIEECLSDSNASHFTFKTEGLSWKSEKIVNESILSARRQHGCTFGSCSLDEPDEFLGELK